MIEVELKQDGDPMVFAVEVSDTAGATKHRVTLSTATYEKLTGGKVPPTDCVEAAFRFLLERESKADILQSFDINVISMYFSNFEKEFSNYL
ncbi:MAG: hypothetical protein AAF384_11415 [Pseudomonadota bacterium]